MKLKLSDGENQGVFFAPSRVRCVKMLCAVLALLMSLSLTARAEGKSLNLISTAHKLDEVRKLSFEDRKLAEYAVYSCTCATKTYERTARSLENA